MARFLVVLILSVPPLLADEPQREDGLAAVSTKMLSNVFGYRSEDDQMLQLARLWNQHDELVFAPGMKRFSVNGLVLPLPFAPFYQGDRLYVPVEAVTFLETPLPPLERLPLQLRRYAPAAPVGLRCVFLDAGHGGHDSGAIGPGGLEEKEVTLEVALRLKGLLEASGVRVLMSRVGDYFVALNERAGRANASGAEVFISIHVNAAPTREAVGIETFYLGSAGPASSAARRYGSASEARKLASHIQASLVKALGVPDRGVKENNFSVLRNTAIPAVLVEVGFLTNPASERLLSRTSYRQRLAELVYDGIAAFSRWREP